MFYSRSVFEHTVNSLLQMYMDVKIECAKIVFRLVLFVILPFFTVPEGGRQELYGTKLTICLPVCYQLFCYWPEMPVSAMWLTSSFR